MIIKLTPELTEDMIFFEWLYPRKNMHTSALLTYVQCFGYGRFVKGPLINLKIFVTELVKLFPEIGPLSPGRRFIDSTLMQKLYICNSRNCVCIGRVHMYIYDKTIIYIFLYAGI
jgi:hypothetical protein